MAHINAQGDAPLLSVSELFSLKGKTAICTGATGGLGLSMAIALAEAGADIVSVQISGDPRADMLKEGVKACGRELAVFETNVADSPALRKCFADIWAAGIVPDILLNCAGINRRAKVEDFTDEDIDAVRRTKLFQTLVVNYICQVLTFTDFCYQSKSKLCSGTGSLKETDRARKTRKASIISFIGNYNIAAYAATKGAVLQMTKAMSNEWAKHGINVNCICPGYIKTAMTKGYLEDKEYYNYIIGRTPAGRWGLPEDFRGAIIFLASKASDFVCGTSIVVDGGMIAK